MSSNVHDAVYPPAIGAAMTERSIGPNWGALRAGWNACFVATKGSNSP